MRMLTRALLVVVLAEIVGAGLLIGRTLLREPVPEADLGRVDPLTASDLGALRARLREEEAPSWRKLAEAYLSYGNLPEAEYCFRRAAALEEHSPRLLLGWGLCLSRLGRTGESTNRLRRAAAISQSDAQSECFNLIGRNALREENLAQAEAAFRQAGNLPASLYQLARLLVRTGRFDAAQATLEQLRPVMADGILFNYLAADLAEARGRDAENAASRERAERSTMTFDLDLQRAYLDEAGAKIGFVAQANACQRKPSPDAAADCLLSALKSHPRRYRFLLPLVHAQLAADRIEVARGLLEDAVASDNISAEILELLGDVLEGQGDVAAARGQWERAVTLAELPSIYEKLYKACQRSGDENSTRLALARKLEADGVEAFRRDDLQNAAETLTKSVELNPERGRPWFYLAEAHRASRVISDARQAYARCLSLNPEHGRAALGMSRLPP